MSTEISILKTIGLSINSNFKYSQEANSFIGNAYTSLAGNTYFNGIRFIEGVLVKEDVGHGHTYTFLNGIKIYDLKTKTLLCEKNYHCTYYNKVFIIGEVESMLTDFLFESAQKEGIIINRIDLKNHIENIVARAFKTDQRSIISNKKKLYISQ